MKRNGMVLICLMCALALACPGLAQAEDGWQCLNCWTENEGNYCGECGFARGAWQCHGCGHVNETKFCTNCGKPRLESVYEAGRELYDQERYAEALPAIRYAAEGGHGGALFARGEYFSKGLGGETVNLDRAAECYLASADSGNADACWRIAHYYQNGVSVSQDDAKALAYYEKAAAAGYTWAYANAARYYAEKDAKKALEAYRKAAEADCPDALYQVGLAYEQGGLVEQSDSEALRYFERAAALGHGQASVQAGYAYSIGKTVPQDNEKALAYYRQAAEKAVDSAYYALGLYYENGWNVEQSDTGIVRHGMSVARQSCRKR